ncbi:hypothetical protein BV22DRAFT_1052842, partial [Leucogyrophana mollusca]
CYPWTTAEVSQIRFSPLSPTRLKATGLAQLPNHLVHTSFAVEGQFDEFLQEVHEPRTPVFGEIFSKKGTSLWAVDFEGWRRRPINKAESQRFTTLWFCREDVDSKHAVHHPESTGTVAQRNYDDPSCSRERFRFGFSPPPGFHFDEMGIEEVEDSKRPQPPAAATVGLPAASSDKTTYATSMPSGRSRLRGPPAISCNRDNRFAPYDRPRQHQREEQTSSTFAMKQAKLEDLLSYLRGHVCHAIIEPPVHLDQPRSDIRRDIRWNTMLLAHGIFKLSSMAEVALRYRALANVEQASTLEKLLTRAVTFGMEFNI